MYTVIRFSGKDHQELANLGNQLNGILPGLFGCVDTVRNRFCCTVSKRSNWWAHRQDIIDLITKCAPLLSQASGSKIEVQFDVAIEPEDFFGILVKVVLLDQQLLKMITECRASVVISIYSAGFVPDLTSAKDNDDGDAGMSGDSGQEKK